MSQDDKLPDRKITRLPWFDYAGHGGYSVTICTHNREELFGQVRDGKMILNDMGEIAEHDWQGITDHYPDVVLDTFVVMPNHVHGILLLPAREINAIARVRADTASHVPTRSFGYAESGSLHAIIGNYKAGVTRKVRATIGRPLVVWQSRFYEHILRDEIDFCRHRQYIENNPWNWARDKNKPDLVNDFLL